MSEEKVIVKKAVLTAVEPQMKDKIVSFLEKRAGQTARFHEVQGEIGLKARGTLTIQLDPTGVRCSNIKVWYGCSQAFHDAIQELREDKRIRLIEVSPVGYFPQGVQVPEIPFTRDHKIAHNKPHLFLTNIELT